MAYWRLTLDPPYSFCTEPSFVKTQACADFRAEKDAYNNTWRDPVTKTLMLKPSIVTRGFWEGMRPLTDFRTAANQWKPVKRGTDQADLFTLIKRAGWSAGDVVIGVAGIALQVILQSLADSDDMQWVIESNYLNPLDAAFAIHYQHHADELIAKENMMYVQWANIGLHFSFGGRCLVYLHADTNLPELVHEFQFADPNEIPNQHNRMVFLPIPGLGLVFLHSHIAPISLLGVSSAESSIPRGHLIPLSTNYDSNGDGWLFNASPIRVGANPYIPLTIGIQDVTFPSSGTFLDAVVDPMFRHSFVPDFTTPLVRRTINYSLPGMSATAAFRTKDDTGDWAPGGQRQGRVKVSLATSNNRRTPLVYGWGLQWSPRYANRDTAPLVLAMESTDNVGDSLTSLEFTHDEYWRFEGQASAIVQSDPGRAIVERGDATFLLEKSDDGSTWETMDGGFAQDFEPTGIVDTGGWRYEVKFQIRGMWWRLDEGHVILPTSFDEVNAGDAINKVLLGTGFPQIADADIPLALRNAKLPKSEDPNGWRLAPRQADKGGEIMMALLFLMRKQYIEWYTRFDWDDEAWVIEQKPRDTDNYWRLTPFSSQNDAGARIWAYADPFTPKAESPEGNIVIAEGVLGKEPRQRVLSAPIVNQDSLSNPDHPDYLGRVKWMVASFKELSGQGELNRNARRVFDAAAHRRLTGDRVTLNSLQLGIEPNTSIRVLDDTGATILDGWVKRRSVVVEVDGGSPFGSLEHTILMIDTVWEGLVN